MRADAAHNAERALQSTITLLRTEPEASLEEIAAAAEVSRATVYRHFGSRAGLVAPPAARGRSADANERDALRPAGELAGGPTPLDVTEVLNKVPPHLLGDQIVAEAQRLDGVTSVACTWSTSRARTAAPGGLGAFPETLDVPLAVGPEIRARACRAARADRATTSRAASWRRSPCADGRWASCWPSTRPSTRWWRSPARPPPRSRWPMPTPTSSTSPAGAGDQPGGRDPAEPAPAADPALRRSAGRRQRAARLRDRRRLVRLRREPRRGLARRRRQHGHGTTAAALGAVALGAFRAKRRSAGISPDGARDPPDDPRSRRRRSVRQRHHRPLARAVEHLSWITCGDHSPL